MRPLRAASFRSRAIGLGIIVGLFGCDSSPDAGTSNDTGASGAAGAIAGGNAGSGGQSISGTGGTSGTGESGTSGTSGIAGTAGTAGAAGTAGTGAAAGTSGASGAAGTGGASGEAGSGGNSATGGVAGAGGSAGGSMGFECNAPAGLPCDAVIPAANGLPGHSAGRITGLEAGGLYRVSSVAPTGENIDLVVCGDVACSDSNYICASQGSGASESCLILSPTGELFLALSNQSPTETSVHIDAALEALSTVDLASFPVSGDLAPGRTTHYHVTGLTPNLPYTFRVTPNAGAAVKVFMSSDLIGNQWLCSADAGVNAAICDFVPQQADCFVALSDASGMGESYSFEIEQPSANAEVLAFPGAFPLTGGVQASGSKYYSVTGLTVGDTYELAVQSDQGRSLWSSLCQDVGCSQIACSALAEHDFDAKMCSLIATQSEYTLRVLDTSGLGDGYSLLLSSTQISFPAGFPVVENLGPYQARWERVDGLVSGTTYVVKADSLGTHQVSLQVNDSSGFTSLCSKYGATSLSCEVTPSGNALYVNTAVQTSPGMGLELDMSVKPAP